MHNLFVSNESKLVIYNFTSLAKSSTYKNCLFGLQNQNIYFEDLPILYS